MKFADRITNQRGVALIAVIFILVALGGLGVTVSKLSQNQAKQASSAVGVQDSYYAAQSGLEWAYQQVTDNAGTAGYTAATGYSSLVGNRTLPNGDIFTIAYAAPNLSSTAKKGNDERKLVLASADTLLPQVPGGGGGGGTDPNESCAVAADSNTTGTDLLTSSIASGNTVSGISGGATGTTPKTFSMPAFPTGVTYTNRTYDGGTTNLTSSTPDADKPELYFGNLKLKGSGTMNVTGPTGVGKYLTVYVNGDFDVQSSSTLNITGNVRIVVGTAGSGKDAEINGSTISIASGGNLLILASEDFKAENNFAINSGGTASAGNFLAMARNDVKVENSGSMKGGLYALDDVKIENSATITGSLVAADKIERTGSSTVTFDNTAGQSVVNNIPTC